MSSAQPSRRPTWQTIVREKCEIRSKLVEPYALANAGNEDITSIDDVDRLVERMAKGELSARHVTKAHVRRLVSKYAENCGTRL